MVIRVTQGIADTQVTLDSQAIVASADTPVIADIVDTLDIPVIADTVVIPDIPVLVDTLGIADTVVTQVIQG